MSRQAEYAEYLKSDRWRALREAARQRDGNACRLCDSADELEVHHRRYPEVFGTESVDDLTTLCAECHGAHHAPRPREIDLAPSEVRRVAPASRLEAADGIQVTYPEFIWRRAAADAQRALGRSAEQLQPGDQERMPIRFSPMSPRC